jgi:hypothetical protein
MMSSTILLRSTWLPALTSGSTSRLSSPGGGQTPSWNMEPVSEPLARRRCGTVVEFWVLLVCWDAMDAFRERVLIFCSVNGRWKGIAFPLDEPELSR